MSTDMKKAGWHEVVVDGIEIEYQTCSHCGRNPTDQEIKALIEQRRKEISRYTCGHCDSGFSFTKLQVMHYKSDERDTWSSMATYAEPRLHVQFAGALEPLELHLRCAKKIFPKMDENTLKMYCQ